MRFQRALDRLFGRSPVAFGILIAAVLFIGALCSMLVLHRVSEDALKENIRTNLKRVAEVAATVVDPVEHAKFTSRSQETSIEYERAIAPLRKLQDSDKEIAFVYTCVLRDGKVYFVLDPTEEGDSDGDGVDDKSHIMEEYEDVSDFMVRALSEGLATSDPEPYTDRWGTFVSGYAPIRREDGSVAGMVGVDISAETYVQRLAAMRSAMHQGLTVAAILALTVGLLGGLMRGSVLRQREEADRKENEHREQLASAYERLELAYQAVELSRKRFSQLFEGLPVPCLTFDNQLHLFEWNAQALDVFGFSAEDALQRRVAEVLGGSFEDGSFDHLAEIVAAGGSVNEACWTDGKRHFLFSCHPLFGPSGEIAGGIIVAVDVTRQQSAEDQVRVQLQELKTAHELLNEANEGLLRANEQLEELAATDSLTGLANKRILMERLAEFIELAKRGQGFSVIMADIDHFKKLNDEHGHLAGDFLLREVGKALRIPLRHVDILARYGGEEFCALVRDSDGKAATAIAERMRQTVQSIPTEYGQITISLGVCAWSPEMESDTTVIEKADDALYQAKRAGRNRVVRAGDPFGEAA